MSIPWTFKQSFCVHGWRHHPSTTKQSCVFITLQFSTYHLGRLSTMFGMRDKLVSAHQSLLQSSLIFLTARSLQVKSRSFSTVMVAHTKTGIPSYQTHSFTSQNQRVSPLSKNTWKGVILRWNVIQSIQRWNISWLIVIFSFQVIMSLPSRGQECHQSLTKPNMLTMIFSKITLNVTRALQNQICWPWFFQRLHWAQLLQVDPSRFSSWRPSGYRYQMSAVQCRWDLLQVAIFWWMEYASPEVTTNPSVWDVQEDSALAPNSSQDKEGKVCTLAATEVCHAQRLPSIL